MMRRLPPAARVLGLTVLAALLLPAAAMAQDDAVDPAVVEGNLNTAWVLVATVLVFFMQAGFAFLEIGFSRAKNVGSGIAKIVVNFSVASIMWWGVGFALAFGGAGTILGDQGWFYGIGTETGAGGLVETLYGTTTADGATMSFFIFQFMFCAVSLAIVWGATLERIKFAVYPLFAIVFAGFIYPLIAHWGFGGGLFAEIGPGVQDFAGSSVVHLTGATAAFAACLVLGARRGKYGADGKPRAIPGHSVPLLGLGVLILWLGWFGFNGGSTLGAADNRFAEVIAVTNLGAAGGVLGAWLGCFFTKQNRDVGIIANGAIGGLVAITAPSGYIEMWPAPIIGLIGGLIVVFGVLAIDKLIDDPIGATSAHGLAGIWGTLACGIFTSPRLAEYVDVGQGGLWYGEGFGQLGAQAAAVGLTFVVVFVLSFVAFQIIKLILGGSLRVSPDEEDAGLDIAEHGMYGYPEQFIPAPELVGYSAPPTEIAAELGRTGRSATATSGKVNA